MRLNDWQTRRERKAQPKRSQPQGGGQVRGQAQPAGQAVRRATRMRSGTAAYPPLRKYPE
jgi:hypothetical protein